MIALYISMQSSKWVRAVSSGCFMLSPVLLFVIFSGFDDVVTLFTDTITIINDYKVAKGIDVATAVTCSRVAKERGFSILHVVLRCYEY